VAISRDWILACIGSNPEYPFGFACTRCGKKEKLPIKLPLNAYIAWGKSFSNRHRGCVEANPDKAPDLAGDVLWSLKEIRNGKKSLDWKN